MLFDLPLSRIDGPRLAALVMNAVREGRQLEYKEALPGGTDDEKREFLADVTSFANAAGGDLLYGVRERRDAQGRPTGEPETIMGLPDLNLDVHRQRLENLMRDGIDPRLPAVTFHEIRRDPDPPCLLLRVPRSWAGLHMVTFKGASRFYGRNSSGKYQLDVGEIRTGFLAAEAAFERVRRFRSERIARILAGETPILVGPGPTVILHGLPVGTSDAPWQRFGNTDEGQIPTLLPPLDGLAQSWRFNLDGFVTYTIRNAPDKDCYAQLFRDGGVEAFSGGTIAFDELRGGGFHGYHLERTLIRAFRTYQRLWTHLAVDPPMLVGVTLTGVRGRKIVPGGDWFREEEATFERDPLVIPEVVVDDLSVPAESILHPLFDLIWNAGGWPRSPNYDDEGRWLERRR